MYTLLVTNDLTDVLEQMWFITNEIDSDDEYDVELEINFQNRRWVEPTILAVLAAFVEKLRVERDMVSVECVNINDDNRGYISRMDFFEEVGFDNQEWFNRHDESGRFIPIKRITEENRFAIANEVSTIISTRWAGIDSSIVAALDWSIAEIIDNVYTHSKTVIDGFVVAQYFPGLHKIDIMMIDGGIGIPNRLRENHEYANLKVTTALKYAVEKDVTVNSETNKGAGLYYTKRIIEENQGELRIHSDKALLVVNENGARAVIGPVWKGTIVKLQIRTDVTIDPTDVWGDNIPVTVGDYMEEGFLW